MGKGRQADGRASWLSLAPDDGGMAGGSPEKGIPRPKLSLSSDQFCCMFLGTREGLSCNTGDKSAGVADAVEIVLSASRSIFVDVCCSLAVRDRLPASQQNCRPFPSPPTSQRPVHGLTLQNLRRFCLSAIIQPVALQCSDEYLQMCLVIAVWTRGYLIDIC